MRKALAILSVFVVAGCANPLEVQSITPIVSITGSSGVDVHEPRRAAGTPGVPQFAGDQLIEARTYARRDGGEIEIAGANCNLSAADFNARLTTPARVRVPLYRAQSGTLAVSCELPGYRNKMVTVSAVDVTREQRSSSGVGGGLVGVLAMTAIDAFSDNTQNDWRYLIAKVVLEPIRAGT